MLFRSIACRNLLRDQYVSSGSGSFSVINRGELAASCRGGEEADLLSQSASIGIGDSATGKNSSILGMTMCVSFSPVSGRLLLICYRPSRRVYREEGGMRGLYRGLTPTAAGVGESRLRPCPSEQAADIEHFSALRRSQLRQLRALQDLPYERGRLTTWNASQARLRRARW